MTLESQIINLIKENKAAEERFEKLLSTVTTDLKSYVSKEVEAVRLQFAEAVVGETIDLSSKASWVYVTGGSGTFDDTAKIKLETATIVYSNALISPRVKMDLTLPSEPERLYLQMDNVSHIFGWFKFGVPDFVFYPLYSGVTYDAVFEVDIYSDPRQIDGNEGTKFEKSITFTSITTVDVKLDGGEFSIEFFSDQPTELAAELDKLLKVSIGDVRVAVDVRKVSFELSLARQGLGPVGRDFRSRNGQ